MFLSKWVYLCSLMFNVLLIIFAVGQKSFTSFFIRYLSNSEILGANMISILLNAESFMLISKKSFEMALFAYRGYNNASPAFWGFSYQLDMR